MGKEDLLLALVGTKRTNVAVPIAAISFLALLVRRKITEPLLNGLMGHKM